MSDLSFRLWETLGASGFALDEIEFVVRRVMSAHTLVKRGGPGRPPDEARTQKMRGYPFDKPKVGAAP